MAILEIANISKNFGEKSIIKNLSLSVEEKTIYGFLGQNGAGKTTVMKMILGLHKIDAGKIFVCDEEVTFGQTNTNKYIGYLADVPSFYDFMTAPEYLKLCADITAFSSKSDVNKRIDEMLNLVGLEANKKKIKTYSRGMKQRLGIAQALLHKPALLICDEPTSALDPVGRKEILDILKAAANETTIIFSTHILSDVEKICDQIGILSDGALKLDIDINTLQNKFSNTNIKLELTNTTELNRLIEVFDEHVLKVDELALELKNISRKEVYQMLSAEEIYPVKLSQVEADLETIFMEVINNEI